MKNQNRFDAAKVRHFREAIRRGTYQVDAERLAARIIAGARYLAVSRSRPALAPPSGSC